MDALKKNSTQENCWQIQRKEYCWLETDIHTKI